MTLRFILFYALSSLVAGGQIQNIAQSKSAEQSSRTDANVAVDTSYSSCTLAYVENNPWWRVDLEAQRKILGVITSSGSYSLNGIEIWIDTSLDETSTSIRCGMIPSFSVHQSQYLSCNGVKGRYVTVSLPGSNRSLSLCEVQVFPTSFAYPQANVAVKGEAVQSSTLFPAVADWAIDGKRRTFYTEGSCSHTGTESYPWWRVDLHQTYIVSQVKITNRGDCCPERLDGAQIRIGNSLYNNGNSNPWCTTITHIPRGNTFTFICHTGSMEGRYVNVVIPGDKKILTLCEVEVYGDPAVEPLHQVAARNNAYQSSTKVYNPNSTNDQYEASAYKAVETCRTHTLSKDCCVETEWEHDAWWQVDLGSQHRVSAVAISNREDSLENITDARIKIGNHQIHHYNPTCAIIYSPALTQTFYCYGRAGRFVSISIPNNTLSFCRVEVYGSPVVSVPEPVITTTGPPIVDVQPESAQIGDRTVYLMERRLCWSDALLYCREHYWDLLNVQSPEEQAQVEDLLGRSSFPLSDNIWLGLRREVMGMQWFWMSGNGVTFQKWRTYPTMFPNPCGGMESDGGLWAPLPCGELNNFLCQTNFTYPTNTVFFYSTKKT